MTEETEQSSFIKEALSTAGEPSSKRVLAALALLVAILIFISNIVFKTAEINFTHYFDSLLLFSAGCLGGTVVEAFKKPKE